MIGDIERLRTKVGSADYAKVDAHLEGLRAIERRFETTPPAPSAGCTKPEVPPATTSQWENSSAFPGEATAMIDLAVHSLACDLTLIASVQLSRGFSNIVHEWFGHNSGHHTISSIRHLMGATDINSFGNLDVDTGPLAGV